MRFTTRFFLVGLILLIASCTKVKDLFNPPSPREIYAREFDKYDLQYILWQQAYEESFNDSLKMFLAHQEIGRFSSNALHVYSYKVGLERGEIFHFELAADSVNARIFIDLFRETGDSLKRHELVKQNEPDERNLRFDVEESGVYKIIIQPALNVSTSFSINTYSLPSYLFPVAGYGNSAIQSFWGDSRDFGKRRHEGIDIFARRGTPVVAATDGRIQFTGEKGLGGKQVWLRTELFGGNSIYYAHLDSIKAYRGRRVQQGDTLGFVGNTGNAITTPTHLHFGIYGGKGAVNPMPFVYKKDKPEFPNLNNLPEKNEILVTSPVANLRIAATVRSKKIGEARRTEKLQLLGIAGEWKHIQTEYGLEAFIHQSLVQ